MNIVVTPEHGAARDGKRVDAINATTQGDRFLDQFLVAGSDRLREIVNRALTTIDQLDAQSGGRKRRRREADLRVHRELVETVIANLAYAVIDKAGAKTIAVSLSKQRRPTRYDRNIFRQLPRLLTMLEDCGVLKLTKSQTLRRRSTIEPTLSFCAKVEAAGVGFADFARHEREELIVLSRTMNGFDATGAFGKQREWIDYKHDTKETRRYRSEIARINAFLEGADIELVPGDPASSISIDTHRRRLRRYFTLPARQSPNAPRFDCGGRLFGGWWENLPREERHRIRINGERIADLDFASMFPRLAYLKLALKPPEGDLYAGITGLEDAKYRDAIKGAMNTMLSAGGPKTRMPTKFRKLLPDGWTYTRVKAAVARRHPDFMRIFETGVGLELMFTESQIMAALMLRMIAEGIVALPMHDGVMVAASEKQRVRRIMRETAEEEVGFPLPISEKELKG